MEQRIPPTAPVQQNHLRNCEELHCWESPATQDKHESGKNQGFLFPSHSLATQALQSTICQPHLPVPVTVTRLCWFSTSSGLNRLGVSRTLSQPLPPTGEVKGLQQATLTPRAGNQPDGALVTCPPQSMVGGTTGDSLCMCPYSCRGYFPPFPGACAGGPHFLETFANREATCRSAHQGVVLPSKTPSLWGQHGGKSGSSTESRVFRTRAVESSGTPVQGWE